MVRITYTSGYINGGRSPFFFFFLLFSYFIFYISFFSCVLLCDMNATREHISCQSLLVECTRDCMWIAIWWFALCFFVLNFSVHFYRFSFASLFFSVLLCCLRWVCIFREYLVRYVRKAKIKWKKKKRMEKQKTDTSKKIEWKLDGLAKFLNAARPSSRSIFVKYGKRKTIYTYSKYNTIKKKPFLGRNMDIWNGMEWNRIEYVCIYGFCVDIGGHQRARQTKQLEWGWVKAVQSEPDNRVSMLYCMLYSMF